ncbi:hypothetical protein Tco_0939955 [Tanacetum coccineum]|uniref:Uncharacterized protein n=1 Tax=Tanacetum coccineum TaxID=301880 RepID=A0ABQ5DM31_9ASTR
MMIPFHLLIPKKSQHLNQQALERRNTCVGYLPKLKKGKLIQCQLFKALQEQVMEQKKRMDDFIAFKVPAAIEASVSTHVFNEVKNHAPTLVPDVVADFIRPRIYRTVLHVLRNKQISLSTTPRLSTTNITISELKEQLLHMMSHNPDSIEGKVNLDLYNALSNSVQQDKRTDPPKNRKWEKSYKRQKFAGESSSGKDQVMFKSSDYERQPSSTDVTPVIKPEDREEESIEKEPLEEPKKVGWLEESEEKVDSNLLSDARSRPGPAITTRNFHKCKYPSIKLDDVQSIKYI